MGSVLAAEVFTTAHIAVTAAISGGLAFIAALLLADRRGEAAFESVLIGALTATFDHHAILAATARRPARRRSSRLRST